MGKAVESLKRATSAGVLKGCKRRGFSRFGFPQEPRRAKPSSFRKSVQKFLSLRRQETFI
jgi:hypothetical protein